MKKITTWMVLMAIAASPLLAQEPEPSETEEIQEAGQAVEEAVVEEATVEEAAIEEATIQEAPPEEELEWETNEWVDEPLESEPQPAASEELEEIDRAFEEAIGGEAAVEEVVPEEAAPEEEAYEEREYIYDDSRPKYREVQTLMSGGGGYGGLSVGYTEVNDLPTLQMGARAAWLIGHGFGLGIAGTGFTSDLTPVNSDFYALSGGYGGLLMEPIILGWLPVHVAFPVVIGGGGIASYSTNADLWSDNFDPYFHEYSVFFVGEAGVEIEFNMVKFFRLSLYGNYRWTTALDMKPMYGLDPSSEYPVGSRAMQGWSAGVRFKFGSF
jgi:hypothetical protein